MQFPGLGKWIRNEIWSKNILKFLWNKMAFISENQFFCKIHLQIIDFKTKELKLDC